jgi:hypothetical protein
MPSFPTPAHHPAFTRQNLTFELAKLLTQLFFQLHPRSVEI